MKSSSTRGGSSRSCRHITGPPNLRRIRKMILRMDGKNRRKSTMNTSRTNRQEISRKEKRKMKKVRGKAYHAKKLNAGNLQKDSFQGNLKVLGKNREKNKRKKRNRALKLREEQAVARREEELALANKEDERTIKKLENNMNFRKKIKKNALPFALKADGLDYLLDVVNQDYNEMIADEAVDCQDNPHSDLDAYSEASSDSNNESGCDSDQHASVSFKKQLTRIESHQCCRTSESTDNEELDIHVDEAGMDEAEQLEKCTDAHVESKLQGQKTSNPQKRKHTHIEKDGSNVHQDSLAPQKSSAVKMDPYGNVVDEHQRKSTESYIPPQKRAKMMGCNQERHQQLGRLQKQLKGLINRLSESNIQSISGQIEELYLTNSRNDMNQLLTELVLDSCVGQLLSGDRLVMEHIMLIAVLNASIGTEVGAHFIETLARRFADLYSQGENYGDGKQCDNVILLFTHLYNFRVIHCTLMYDIIRKLADNFTERDIEMLLLILKNTGLMLRKDDPEALKEIILQIQTKAKTCPEEFQRQSRVKFMLETIYAVRNNNVRKIPNYDPDQLQRMKKTLKAMIKAKGHTDSETTLRISLEHLLSVEERGRWWIIGSSWSSNKPKPVQQHSSSEKQVVIDTPSNTVVELFRQQRMNTELRKAIFSIVMTAEDYLDGYEKILHLSLKSGQEREVVHVIINCCLQESVYNPYYAHLGTKLCQHDRKYKMAFQFAFWDKFKILSEFSSRNLALLISQMLLFRAISISVLKVIEFADIDKTTVHFLRQTLRSLLLSPSQKSVMAVFSSVTSLQKLQSFRESLRLFLLHFLLSKKNTSKTADLQVESKLRERVQQANQILAEDCSATF
ncbi:nucleolar MIF4G domain-containing protein 1-like isoform X2 [Acanthaster planci]|nr:nucleolar MIF4G domain-containing protein 1-like isoform X2 [Acanthaster planci]XP_022099084.1 nucleolar MIF4G domain-containing protein 1-like isoform X2 [Acanthaster planci]XP_022099085.1 nucleolar MIF4G domain-containing protein 1-like isoform X2 [Acanthaster planci]XP_022099086.1 nucleolar MIF4G domain-containing protein 1-like isoform X2 [Acanthaster planci]